MTVLFRNPFDGAQVVVVGGSAGIGLATAAALKAAGALVTLVGRDAARLARASEQIGGARTEIADLARREQIERVLADMERIDHLVITAGVLRAGRVVDSDPDQLLEAIQERIAGALYTVRAAVGRMPSSGSIVLTGGQYADRPTDQGTALTAAAVRGIEALARALALELAPIRVNVVAPGLIETTLFDGLGAEVRAAIFEAAAKALPVGRVGAAQEVAEAIVFLLANGYMNGEVLHIDGGGRLV